MSTLTPEELKLIVHTGARASTVHNYLAVLMKKLQIRHVMPRVYGKSVYAKNTWWSDAKATAAVRERIHKKALAQKKSDKK